MQAKPLEAQTNRNAFRATSQAPSSHYLRETNQRPGLGAQDCRVRMAGTRSSRTAPGKTASPQPHQTTTTTATAACNRPAMPQQEVWTSTEDLFWDHMREVQNKWNTLKLNDDIWAKLIYFEQNRRLAKAYVSTPVLTIDGSTNGLDGFRIGLSGIENSYRDLDSISCLRSIGQGVKLKIDHQGNILIRKLAAGQTNKSSVDAAGQTNSAPRRAAASCSVWVKKWPSKRPDRAGLRTGLASSSCSSNDSDYSQLSSSSQNSPNPTTLVESQRATLNTPDGAPYSDDQEWPMQEIADSDKSYKLFDMQAFRLQLERNRRTAARNLMDGTSTTPIDWRQCVSIISFDRTPKSPANRSSLGRPARALDSEQQQQQQILTDPCWIMLINIIAIDMLKSSVCDSRPSPRAQASALINKYQSEPTSRATTSRTTTRRFPTGPEVDSQVSSPRERPMVSQTDEDDYGRAEGGRAKSMSGNDADFKSAQDNRKQSSTSRGQHNSQDYVYSSERLKRLNKFRQQQEQLGLSTKQSNGGQLGMELPLFKQTGEQRSASQSSQQLEGSIYTTFTGKYLDKQHRLRANERSSTLANYNQSQADDSSRSHYSASYLARPIGSLKTNCSSRLLNKTPDVQLQIEPRWRPAERGHHLTHSLSAFDLSHGLKLNLRSINSSSIKMNFDSDGDEEDGADQEEAEHDANKKHAASHSQGGGSMERHRELIARFDGGKQSATRSAHNQQAKQMTRKTTKAANEETSEWATLAKKYSLRRDEEKISDSGEKSIESVDGQMAADVNKPEEDDKAASDRSQEQLDSLDGKENKPARPVKMQQNVSRSSIASSSSGCADNDYFNSQSSNSSMSSSRSHEGEELSSQPASSSGIVCSGNTSDEYERRQIKLRDACEPPELFEQQAEETLVRTVKSSGGYRQHKLQSKKGKLAAEDSTGANGKDVRQQRVPATRQAISLARGHNGKSMEILSSCSKVGSNVVCGGCEHQPEPEHQRHLCDCGASSCDQILGLDALSNNACDCFCDCLYQSHSPQLSYMCHEELCDCTGTDDTPDREAPFKEDPIYDHLPRFGKSQLLLNEPDTTRRDVLRSNIRTISNHRDAGGSSAARRGAHDRILPLPLPGQSEYNLVKSKKQFASSGELKRNKGWLESRKYIKLFPRFMFSSSSSTSSNTRNEKQDNIRKSDTLDRVDQMANRFRRIRSSQNLSK